MSDLPGQRGRAVNSSANTQPVMGEMRGSKEGGKKRRERGREEGGKREKKGEGGGEREGATEEGERGKFTGKVRNMSISVFHSLTYSPHVHRWSILCVSHQQFWRTVPPCCNILCVFTTRPC